MLKNEYVPKPFSFNALKHHLKFCREVCYSVDSGSVEWENLITEVALTIGNNVIDIYTGKYDVDEIALFIGQWLSDQDCFSREKLQYMLKNKNYQIIPLLDQSRWVLRLGHGQKEYIHIHPARSGSFLFRTKANCWKTALVYVMLYKPLKNARAVTRDINHVRQDLLLLSPIKSIESSNDISTCIHWLAG